MQPYFHIYILHFAKYPKYSKYFYISIVSLRLSLSGVDRFSFYSWYKLSLWEPTIRLLINLLKRNLGQSQQVEWLVQCYGPQLSVDLHLPFLYFLLSIHLSLSRILPGWITCTPFSYFTGRLDAKVDWSEAVGKLSSLGSTVITNLL